MVAEPFFTSLDFATAVSGGVVGSVLTYWLTKRSEKVAAAYTRLEYVLGEPFTKRRLEIHGDLKTHGAVELCIETHANHRSFRESCVFVLNYFDMLLYGVQDGVLDETVVRRTLWPIIRHDYDSLSEWVAVITKKAADQTSDGKPKVAFPMIDKYRNKWI